MEMSPEDLVGQHQVRLPSRAPKGSAASLADSPTSPVQIFGSLRASSPAMHGVFSVLGRLAVTPVTVTITGETGTGKDVLAHAIHDASPRRDHPFVVFDCGAIPSNLIESELFGHERGAFTGAHAEHAGAFERAGNGTLFLDEIGELPLELQPRLLRALENRTIRRVGGTREHRVGARIIAATNRDLGVQVAAKQFRQDLYFRLAAAVIHLPPLRDRLEDLPLLVQALLSDLGRTDVRLSADAHGQLESHYWPGNVRELKNVLSCSLAFVDADVLEADHLRFVPAITDERLLEHLPLAGNSLASVEQVTIRQTLILTGGNKTRAARLLGISASTLHEKLNRTG